MQYKHRGYEHSEYEHGGRQLAGFSDLNERLMRLFYMSRFRSRLWSSQHI
ncbi:hypothetical protein HMPREF3192_00589 [Atopobium deltae]|uniref:Uncharacterized protein n=1 Tax=Atopobium deltae TaxID=1393034 RepID=A0A133XVJ9_9ACTN|nr:hypothetical protein HMPREF3192_00589 [Atopobium deltae]